MINLVPGFPLDGGRMLRAVVWGITGDVYRATRWAAALGRAFGIALIAAGIAMFLGIPVPIFGVGPVSGMWQALIGWFLHNAALMSYRKILARRALEGVPVSRLMVPSAATVTPDTPVPALVDDYLIAHDQRSIPVVRDGRLVGLVGIPEVRKAPPDTRGRLTVADVMTPADELSSVQPDLAAVEALEMIARRGMDPLPVVDHGQVRGLLRREDILKWLALRGDEEAIA